MHEMEPRVPSLGQEDALEKEMATLSSVLAWRIPWIEEPGGYSPWGHKESDTTEQLNNNSSSKFPILCYFQAYIKVIQLYVCVYFLRFFSIIGYCKILNIVPRAVQ